MESSEEPTSLQSICHLQASELFPKPTNYECEDPTLTIPFSLLSGEYLVAVGRTSDGMLALTNYRLYLQLNQKCYNIPIGLIEQVEVKEIFYLHISCKDARSISCAFATNDQCMDWQRRLNKVTFPRKSIEEMFAFAYHVWIKREGKDNPRLGKETNDYLTNLNTEVERLKFNLHGTWRISHINRDYQMCPSYPPQILVPACISDDVLEEVAKFRSSRRIPSVVWRHVSNGAVIARSSQPEVGWLGWRSKEDEDFLKALADACSFDRGESTMIDSTVNSDLGDEPDAIVQFEPKKVLIVDARSYTTAVANRARGGGCECSDYYTSCEIQFMSLPNIHYVRKSFHAVRQLCASDADPTNWLSLLEGTRWLQHMSGLLRAAVTVASAIERDGRPVLVHCSDGWDRTPQIVALAQILLDPYYRTMEGFQVLCEREWLDFGHKFADRCGHTVGCEDPNERCPVFLQWLDCVHQLAEQFECSFEMAPAYFVKLAQHTYSQLFGTFLCNNKNERLKLKIRDNTFSVWRFINSPSFYNHLYSPSKHKVLWPSCNLRDLRLWPAVYLGTVETPIGTNDVKPGVSMIDIENGDNEEPQGQMTKTRSFGDLVQLQDHAAHLHRRLSDPSISIEKKFDSLNLENEPEKIETNNDSDKPQIVSENTKETDDEKKLPNGETASNETSVTISADSSTDTIIPNNDLNTEKVSEEKKIIQMNHVQDADPRSVFIINGTRTYSNRTTEGSDVSEASGPLASRTSSSICPASPIHHDIMSDNFDGLDDIDGLPVIQCEVQMRVQQIIAEHKLKEEALRKELHTTRMALIKQVCNHNVDSERVDDIGSLPDSVGSVGDHGESIPSDMSWEALDEPGAPTLWVPDHAVNECMGCGTEFWLGRRKHHCRCCGKIFCADCSENSTPLPDEQLYNPVRVCSDCFTRLQHHTSPCQCTGRHQSRIFDEAVIEPAQLSPPPPTMATGCHRSARKGKEDSCGESFQFVQQKIEASKAN